MKKMHFIFGRRFYGSFNIKHDSRLDLRRRDYRRDTRDLRCCQTQKNHGNSRICHLHRHFTSSWIDPIRSHLRRFYVFSFLKNPSLQIITHTSNKNKRNLSTETVPFIFLILFQFSEERLEIDAVSDGCVKMGRVLDHSFRKA